MQIALLLAACLAPAALEWVEISQQHYRKPVRGHAYPEEDEPLYYPVEEETRLIGNYPEQEDERRGANPMHPVRVTNTYPAGDGSSIEDNSPKGDRRIYSNQSMSGLTKNQNGVSNNVKLVGADNYKIKANVTPQFSLEIYEPVIEDTPELVTRKRLKEQERIPATVERVPNKGNVKRVQLSNTPVKSPSVKNAISSIRRNGVNKYGLTPVDDDFSDEFDMKSDIFKNVQEGVIDVTPINDVKHVFSSTKTTPVRIHDRIITSTGWPTSDSTMPFDRYPQIHITRKSDIQKENNGRDIIKNLNMKNVSNVDESRVADSNIKSKDNPTKPAQSTMQDEIPKVIHKDIHHEAEDIEVEEVTISSGIKNHSNEHKRPPGVNANVSKDQSIRLNSDTLRGGGSKPNEEIKVNTMENVMKFMKVVADAISKNTKRGVNGKVKYLNELKDTLLCSIKERIEVTWPDDASSPARRRSRSATARGHVEFPSSESALMTISFLTFAVFLIKLVLQVIQTYKNKAMMVAPLVVATAGRTVRKLRTVH